MAIFGYFWLFLGKIQSICPIFSRAQNSMIAKAAQSSFERVLQ
jgi:hypothetical protein